MSESADILFGDALQTILVQASEQPIEPVDFQTAKRYCNRMMASFAANGINLGYTNIVNPTDLVTIPDGAIEGLLANLAIRLLPTYDLPLTAELSVFAKEGKSAMRKLSVTVTPSRLPCTLPIGSGNEHNSTGSISRLFSCPEDTILTEQGGNILLEDNTHES